MEQYKQRQFYWIYTSFDPLARVQSSGSPISSPRKWHEPDSCPGSVPHGRTVGRVPR